MCSLHHSIGERVHAERSTGRGKPWVKVCCDSIGRSGSAASYACPFYPDVARHFRTPGDTERTQQTRGGARREPTTSTHPLSPDTAGRVSRGDPGYAGARRQALSRACQAWYTALGLCTGRLRRLVRHALGGGHRYAPSRRTLAHPFLALPEQRTTRVLSIVPLRAAGGFPWRSTP